MFNFVNNYNAMNLQQWYAAHFEADLKGRYVTLEHLQKVFKKYEDVFKISSAGSSENGKDIPLITVGYGTKNILAWSQMHGNESTTTKAVFDLLKFLHRKDIFQTSIDEFLSSYTLYILPILNTDGAAAYTRENANHIDLNRDAQALTQQESIILRDLFTTVAPVLCLNLHDQRSIYGLHTGFPAVLSFLAPAADEKRTITPARKEAMAIIVKMYERLQAYIPGQIGRYDDTFNKNCVGDSFQQQKVPTILFEAGHYKEDYQREKTREYVFYAFLALFDIGKGRKEEIDYNKYLDIPENKNIYNDILLKNVKLEGESPLHSVAIQYVEVLDGDKIKFIPTIDSIDKTDKGRVGHKEIDIKGEEILINSQQNIHVGIKVLTISNKKQPSIVYFSSN